MTNLTRRQSRSSSPRSPASRTISLAPSAASRRVDDHFENEKYIISSAVGHLVELCLPSELDVKRGKWSFANLPIIPEEFELKPIEKSKPRFNMLKRLIQRKDVTELINACDAGREGELIFRYLVKLTGSKKPIRRLWLQSMTAESIRSAFAHLRVGRRDDSAGQGRGLPFRERLAGRHQWHPRHDRVQ